MSKCRSELQWNKNYKIISIVLKPYDLQLMFEWMIWIWHFDIWHNLYMWCITGHFCTIIVYTYCRDRAGFGFENVFKYQNEWHLHYVNIWELLSQLNWDNMKCGVCDNWMLKIRYKSRKNWTLSHITICINC